MARSRWYFYNGRVPVPVRLPDGRVFAVRPRGHVFTSKDSVRKYGAKFRPCANPENADALLEMLSLPVEAPPSKDALKESAGPVASSVVELGRATMSKPAPEPTAEKETKASVRKISRKRRKSSDDDNDGTED